jgi:hypothetical protein
MLVGITKENEMNKNYTAVFQTAAGQRVLDDLDRVVNMTKIDANNPNPNSAVWKVAQQALLQRIYNQIDQEAAHDHTLVRTTEAQAAD